MSTIQGIRGVPGFPPASPAAPATPRSVGSFRETNAAGARPSGASSFGEILGQALNQSPSPFAPSGASGDKDGHGAGQELNFSAHAQARVSSRGIDLSAEDLRKLESAVDRAGAKGSRDTLLMFRGAGFIVNVPSRTVVTAVDEAGLRERVFTNIDSTVWVE